MAHSLDVQSPPAFSVDDRPWMCSFFGLCGNADMGSGRCEARQMCSKYLHMALALAYGAFDPKKSCIHGSQPTHVLPCMDMVMACLVVVCTV